MAVKSDTPAANVRVVRVFVSSPNDVAAERGRVQSVTANLNREYESLVRFETVLWEEYFYKADRSFQPQIVESVACDLVVSIFWTRIGTELPPDFQRLHDGRPYPSGTAYELLTALDASKSKGAPDVYVFRKTADAALPTTDAERRRQTQTQLDALEAFWGEWFKSGKGQFKAAFQTFASTDAFETQLEELLRQWLNSHGLLGPRLAWPKEKGAPFPGLAPFEAEHAAVFFGRDRATDEARRRLVEAADRKSPFLLIVGASGAGKSSLVRAGLIPRLTTPGMVASVDIWRVARLKPGESQAGPLLALATALFDALPELGQGDYPSPVALAENLRRGGEVAAHPVLRVLARIAETAQRERHSDQALRSALVLLVDQLEEVFAQGVSDSDRAAFAESLAQLVATGRVWCIGTLRADLYELLLRQPVLKALKEAGASLDLGPPGAAELAEIVRAPAKAAGLAFENNLPRGDLDERLLADANTADSLPLLQFTLRQLYERRVEADGQIRLTHSAYEALGGLEGAIAEEAERAIAGVSGEILDALPRMLRRLAEPARDGKSLTLREIPQAEMAAAPAEAALAAALLGARILVAGKDAAGRPTVRLAHDAVFSSWPRAKAAAQASREFYRVRAEVKDALQRWQEHGRPKDRLIPPGVPLAEAEKLVKDFGVELSAELTAYVSASRHRARQRQRVVAGAAVFFFVLAVVASATGILAYRAQQKATRNFRIAKKTAESLVFNIAQELRNVEGMRAESVRKILDTARKTFEQLAASAPDDPELQRDRAVALNEFGYTYEVLGNLREALRAYRDGLAIAERLAKSDPANTGWQRDLSVSYENVGDVLLAQGKLPEALDAYRDGLAITERLTKTDSGNTGWQRDLSVSYDKVGDVLLAQDKLPEALSAYRDSTNIRERLAKTDLGNTEWQRDLSVSDNKIGDVLRKQANLPEALDAYRDGLAIAERLARTAPSNTEWKRDLLVSYNSVGDVLLKQKKLPDALKAYRDGLAIAERLAKSDPGNTGWQRELSVSNENVGDVLVAQDKFSEALEAYRDGLAIAERLAKSDPGNAGWQNDLAIGYDELATVHRRLGNAPEALSDLRKGREITAALVAISSSSVEFKKKLTQFDKEIAQLQAQQARKN